MVSFSFIVVTLLTTLTLLRMFCVDNSIINLIIDFCMYGRNQKTGTFRNCTMNRITVLCSMYNYNATMQNN